jgi:hypothetical protein
MASNQQVRIGVVILIAIAVAVGAWLILGHDSKGKKKQNARTYKAIGPLALHQSGLMARALTLGQPMYWAGPKPGFRYEFWRTSKGYIYVRYLPKGVHVGSDGKKYLVIGTYYVPGAVQALKKESKGRGVQGPHGSYIYARPKDPKSVLIAWPGKPYEVEVYSPHASESATIAESDQVKSVG